MPYPHAVIVRCFKNRCYHPPKGAPVGAGTNLGHGGSHTGSDGRLPHCLGVVPFLELQIHRGQKSPLPPVYKLPANSDAVLSGPHVYVKGNRSQSLRKNHMEEELRAEALHLLMFPADWKTLSLPFASTPVF